jgi:hypothetical protein
MAKIAIAVGFGLLGLATGGLGWFGVAVGAGHALTGLTLGLALGGPKDLPEISADEFCRRINAHYTS